MDLENQKRVKDFADKFGPENLVVVLGAAEGRLQDLQLRPLQQEILLLPAH